MSESIVIIGAGIAGLATGCYAQMNGYRSQIFELHTQPGGLCTSWHRQGYTFDGCIHWLVGSGSGSGMNQIWQELGALQGRQIVNHDEFTRYQSMDGREFILYTNIDRLEQHMLELSPADARTIRAFCGATRRMARFAQTMGQGLKFMLSSLLAGPVFLRYGKMPIQKFCARFQDPFLRRAFAGLFDMPGFPTIGMMMTLAWMHNQDAGYPIGGSLAFAQAIEKRYLELGGEIHYRARVEKILVENGRAVGVRLADGTEHHADRVISAADGHATIFDMLEGRYLDDRIQGYYDHLPIFAPIIQVSLGIARDLSAEPHMVTYELEKPIQIAGKEETRIGFKHYGYDPTLAPAGKSVVEVMFPSNHAYWKAIAAEKEQYEAEKKDIAIKVIDQLERRYPGITSQIEVVDVATPLTYERYTGNWQGSMEGWLITTETMGKPMSKTLPGLENFYMVGQWVEPGGGLPPAATSGRGIIATICKESGKRFVTK